MKVYVVINVIGGIVDDVDTFSQEKDADQKYRELIYLNSHWTGQEIQDSYRSNMDDIWQQDSDEFLYDKHNDLYYSLSTDKHDVYLMVSNIDGEE